MHLFLTGEKQVGKSTAIQTALKECGMIDHVQGFCTVKTNLFDPSCPTVHMLDANKRLKPSANNFLFACCNKEDPFLKQRFDCLGKTYLKNCDHGLVLMDELGPKEQSAKQFQTLIKKVLDSNCLVLGVLQKGTYQFYEMIAKREDVRLLTVTVENRDFIKELIKRWIYEETKYIH